MRAAASLFALAAVAPVVLAGPYFTKPITGDKCTAGQPCEIKWQDDGKAPTLAEFGDCYVGLWTGSQQQQTQMQYISPTNCGSTSSVIFVPDASVGQNSDQYFIKMVSVNAPDPAMPQYKATAYSPKFSLDGMTGSFNQTVLQQIAAAADPSASAPAPASSAPASSAPASASSAATSAAASTPRASSASATRTGTAASSTPSNGAGSVAVAGMGVMGATVVAILAAIF
ncbi:hypothetical protein FS749_006954 [Ceratobasidium sp. UAMH 11750]|nr:hypothetical protein FS749_006954 [Ceratobasidium sp. UAMH 11750]